MERITCNLNDQLRALLQNAFFSDSMIADRLLQRQRAEVEDELEGLNNIGCDEIILKGVMLTEVPNVANPMAHVLKSLTTKLDDPGELFRGDIKSDDIDRLRDIDATGDNPDLHPGRSYGVSSRQRRVKRTHKVFVGEKLLNEYGDNPQLIGGAFAA